MARRGFASRFGTFVTTSIVSLSVVLGVACASALGACSSFGDADLAGTTSDDAGDGSSIQPSDDGGADGRPEEDADSPGLCRATFCDSFERKDIIGDWVLQGDLAASSLSVSNEVSRLGARSLQVRVQTTTPASWLSKEFGVPSKIVAHTWLKVSELGQGELDLFRIASARSEYKPIALVHSGTANRFVLEGPSSSDPKGGNLIAFDDWAFDEWTSVEIELDVVNSRYSLSIGGKNSGPQPLPEAWLREGPFSVEIGVPWVGLANVVTSWQYYFDDVQVDVTP